MMLSKVYISLISTGVPFGTFPSVMLWGPPGVGKSQGVREIAYQITLDRMIGEHKLPKNCIVIAAGNRVTDRSVSYNMPKALANRLCHFEIKEDPYAWHGWAVRKGIHPFVSGYIEYNSSALIRSEGMELAFPTPRSWEMVSNILTYVSDDINAVYPMIVGCIGETAGNLFRTWTQVYASLASVKTIFKKGEGAIPKERETQIALKSLMVDYARQCQDKQMIDKSIEYSCNLPWSFRGKLLQDYYRIPEIRGIVKENEVFQTALRDGLKC